MKSTIEHPLAFFDWYLNSQIDVDLKDFYNTITKEMYYNNIIDIDEESHIIKVRNVHHTEEIKSKYMTYTFEGSIKVKLNRELNHSVKLIETGFLNRFTKTNEVNSFADFLRVKTSILFELEAFQRFPFLQAYLDNITKTINSFSSRPTVNNFTLSFNLLANSTEPVQIVKIVKLYDLLIDAPPLIDCTKDEFIKAFTGQEVEKGINWLVKGKNKKHNKSALLYFMFELINLGHISRHVINDINKHIQYVFRDFNGNLLENIKQSKSSASNNPAQKDRIDTIVSSL